MSMLLAFLILPELTYLASSDKKTIRNHTNRNVRKESSKSTFKMCVRRDHPRVARSLVLKTYDCGLVPQLVYSVI